ncbi:hypothetical protein V8G54_036463 [Vigna mungo]|uniref:Uncharacterized protein n=1 Tax=Vigna mungo TaxID=3915 RepID=A0AAQ3MH84_VIGMU
MILEDQNQEKDSRKEGRNFARQQGKKEVKGRDVVKDSLQNIKKSKKFSEEGEYLKEERYPRNKRKRNVAEYQDSDKGIKKKDGSEQEMEEDRDKVQWNWRKQEELPTFEGMDPMGWMSKAKKEENNDENCDGDIVVAAAEKVAEVAAVRVDNVTNVGREIHQVKTMHPLGCYKFLAESLLTSHLILLTVVKGKDGRKETSRLEVVQTVLEVNFKTGSSADSFRIASKSPSYDTDLNWRTVISESPSYDNKMMMKRNHAIKLQGSNPKDKVVLEVAGNNRALKV